jgi:hypothetical protein
MQRRSIDGYISATGMYKAAFPWSTLEEETHERRHHKSLPSGKGEEVAGNVWIAPEDGMFLQLDPVTSTLNLEACQLVSTNFADLKFSS